MNSEDVEKFKQREHIKTIESKMKKTISVLLCKRVDYGRQVLEALQKAKDIEDWEVYVYQDLPGHPTDRPYHMIGKRVDARDVTVMARTFDFVKDIKVAPRPFGLKAATRWCLNHVFKERGSDLNLHIEDDVLVAEDALTYVEQCEPYMVEPVGSTTLVGYLSDGKPSDEELKKVDKHIWFNCGFGWAMKRDFFLKYFHTAPDMKHKASWAADINYLFKNNSFYELRSLARKSKNIGRDFPTHMMNKDNGLNCKDFKDEWNGGNHGPIWEYDFTALKEDDGQN